MFRAVVWTTVAIVLALVVFTATAGLVNQMAVASVVTFAALGAAAALVRQRLDLRQSLADVPRWARRMFVTGAALLFVQLLPIAAFVIDPNIGTWTARPWWPWQSAHSCVSSYWVTATIADRVPNIYADEISALPQADRSRPRQPRRLGPLNIDAYEYPPTFLPIPRLLAAATADFWQFRRLWFAINLAAIAIVLVAAARRIDTALGSRAVWLTPWVIASPAVVGTLQIGNGHLLFIALTVAAMLLFERGRHAIGGALLAYTILSKLFPGLLLLYLALRREWRALGWTAAWGIVILGITLADLGLTPFIAFVDHLPRLLSGEAFPAFRNPNAIAVNESVPGVVFKVALWGGPPLGFEAARVVGWIYTLFLAGMTTWLAVRQTSRGYLAMVWIALLLLATMRSPFLPYYGGFPSMWLATLMAAVWWHRPAIRWMAIAWWLVLAINTGQGYVSPPVTAAWTFVHTIGAFALVVLAVRQSASSFGTTTVATANP